MNFLYFKLYLKNNITYKYQINSGDVLKNKRELVKKKNQMFKSKKLGNNNFQEGE